MLGIKIPSRQDAALTIAGTFALGTLFVLMAFVSSGCWAKASDPFVGTPVKPASPAAPAQPVAVVVLGYESAVAEVDRGRIVVLDVGTRGSSKAIAGCRSARAGSLPDTEAGTYVCWRSAKGINTFQRLTVPADQVSAAAVAAVLDQNGVPRPKELVGIEAIHPRPGNAIPGLPPSWVPPSTSPGSSCPGGACPHPRSRR